MKGEISPGVAIYHHGMDLVAVLCTSTKAYNLRVRGQLKNNTWVNMGIIYSPTGSRGQGEIRVCSPRYQLLILTMHWANNCLEETLLDEKLTLMAGYQPVFFTP